jgi:hypothetical protein
MIYLEPEDVYMLADPTETKDDLQAMDTAYEQIADEKNDPTIPPSPTG